MPVFSERTKTLPKIHNFSNDNSNWKNKILSNDLTILEMFLVLVFFKNMVQMKSMAITTSL